MAWMKVERMVYLLVDLLAAWMVVLKALKMVVMMVVN